MSNSEILEQNNQKLAELTELVKTKAVGDTSKFLKLPDEAPATQQLVSIGTDGTQQNLNIGDGLTVANGALNAEKIFKHQVGFNRMPETGSPFGSQSFGISFYSSNPKPVETIKEFINLYCNKPIDYEYQAGDEWVQTSIPIAPSGFTSGALADGRRYIKLAPQVSLLLYSTTKLTVTVSRLIDDFTFERETWDVRDEDLTKDTVN